MKKRHSLSASQKDRVRYIVCQITMFLVVSSGSILLMRLSYSDAMAIEVGIGCVIVIVTVILVVIAAEYDKLLRQTFK